MTQFGGCCGFHITTCAKIVAIFGIIGAISTLLSSELTWWNIPLSILYLITHSLIFIGIWKKEAKLILPAEIFLGFCLIFGVTCTFGFLALGWAVTPTDEENYADIQAAKIARVSFLIMAWAYVFVFAYTAYAFIVIRRTRNYLLNIKH